VKLFKRAFTPIILTIAAGLIIAGCMTTGWGDAPVAPGETEYVKVGEVTVEMRVWNVLFLKSAMERRASLVNAAEEKAKEIYGDDAILANSKLTSQWSIHSLLLGLDLFGFVEDATLTGDALRPVPPAPPPEPEPEKLTHISFPILPQDRYDDGFGYISLEYLTRLEVLDNIKVRLDKRDADSEEYEREYAKVPAGGHLIINIGRGDLMHANTRWYSYTVVQDDDTRIEKHGEEGIPNIKGKDGNWWNVVTVGLKAPIDELVEVQVADIKENLVYTFSVTRAEEIL
jgi:hypothetical protein